MWNNKNKLQRVSEREIKTGNFPSLLQSHVVGCIIIIIRMRVCVYVREEEWGDLL